MYPELRQSGVMVTNASGIFSVPMAEHTMGLILALARNFPGCVRYQDQLKWSAQDLWDQPQHLTEINGGLLLIVGYGSIGRELARRARAFDMRVWGVTRSGKGDSTFAEKILPVTGTECGACARRLRGDRRAGNSGDETPDRCGTASRE